jgi:hypothetical protein
MPISSRGEVGVGGSSRGGGMSSGLKPKSNAAKKKEAKTLVKKDAKKTPLTPPTSGVKPKAPGSSMPPKIVKPTKYPAYVSVGNSVKVVKPGSMTPPPLPKWN